MVALLTPGTEREKKRQSKIRSKTNQAKSTRVQHELSAEETQIRKVDNRKPKKKTEWAWTVKSGVLTED